MLHDGQAQTEALAPVVPRIVDLKAFLENHPEVVRADAGPSVAHFDADRSFAANAAHRNRAASAMLNRIADQVRENALK